MKKLAVVVGLVLFSEAIFATGLEPQRPKLDDEQLSRLISRAAYSAFIGDACNIPLSIPEKIKRIVNAAHSTTEKQQEKMSEFTERKSYFSRDAQIIGIWKRCYLEIGKTRVLIKNVEQELDDFYQATSSKLNEYENQHAEWQRQVDKENYDKEAEKRERHRLHTLKLAEQLGWLVVRNAYARRAENIGVKLLEQEYFESNSTYRLKVELTWTNPASDWATSSSGSATGIITADESGDFKTWEYEKQYKWNPQ